MGFIITGLKHSICRAGNHFLLHFSWLKNYRLDNTGLYMVNIDTILAYLTN
jgi:hypothetical protein